MRRTHLICLLLALSTLLVFGRVCGHEFIEWDDNYLIYLNPGLNPPTLQNLKVFWTHSHLQMYLPVTYSI